MILAAGNHSQEFPTELSLFRFVNVGVEVGWCGILVILSVS